MATFRKVHTAFWTDPFVQSLTPEQKYFFLYLLTNDKASQCGVYEITKSYMGYQCGYNVETINKLILQFQGFGKIMYSDQTSEIAIKNWNKWNLNQSPKVQSLVNQQLSSVKNQDLIQYANSIDSVPIHNTQIERDIDIEREREYAEPSTKVLVNQTVVSEIIQTFIKHIPNYQSDQTDSVPALEIAYKIAKLKGWKDQTIINTKRKDCITEWEKIVSWLKADSWYSTKSLQHINRYWKDLMLKFDAPKKEEKKAEPHGKDIKDLLKKYDY